ncbi:MAG: hypothetical protein M1825_005095 [Sarcosagium campestre]|nr:MAG: hypothetical protein M1825_005095 [Sarcosagium campestre]
MSTIQIPADYGYVLLVSSASFVLGILHSMGTARERRHAKVPYPHAYAPPSAYERDAVAATRFDSAQKAHANFSENLTPAVGSMLLAGLEYPRLAAGLGAAWVLGRTLYVVGYVGSKPGGQGKGRMLGSWAFIVQGGLIALTARTGWAILSR